MTTDLGGHSEWLPHVDKLILEMLANRTPPSCIQANIFAMSRVLQPEQDIVKELPSLNHIKNLRTVCCITRRLLRLIGWVMRKIGINYIPMKLQDAKSPLLMLLYPFFLRTMN